MSEVVVDGSFRALEGKEADALEARDAHLKTPHIAAVLERLEELFGDSGDITVFEAVPHGEHKKGSLAAHAGD